MDLIVGTVLEGKVSGIMPYGAFVSFEGGGSGLVHISEIAEIYVTDVHDHLTVGQSVKVKVLSVSPEGKVNLSVKQALPREERPNVRKPAPRNKEAAGVKSAPPSYLTPDQGQLYGPGSDASFEEKLKLFMKDSDSRMSSNKLYAEKKGSRRRK